MRYPFLFVKKGEKVVAPYGKLSIVSTQKMETAINHIHECGAESRTNLVVLEEVGFNPEFVLFVEPARLNKPRKPHLFDTFFLVKREKQIWQFVWNTKSIPIPMFVSSLVVKIYFTNNVIVSISNCIFWCQIHLTTPVHPFREEKGFCRCVWQSNHLQSWRLH